MPRTKDFMFLVPIGLDRTASGVLYLGGRGRDRTAKHLAYHFPVPAWTAEDGWAVRVRSKSEAEEHCRAAVWEGGQERDGECASGGSIDGGSGISESPTSTWLA